MKKIFQITNEEFEAITHAVENVLELCHYDFVSATSEGDDAISMSKKTFFEQLKREFEIKD